MKRFIRAALIAFIAVSLVIISVLVAAHYRTKGAVKVAVMRESVSLKIEKIRYSGTRDGRVEWELEAESAQRAAAGDALVLNDVKAVFYSKAGRPYNLKAATGTLLEATGELEAAGGVTVVFGSGERLETSSLTYLPEKRVVSTDDMVMITSGPVDAKGRGFEADIGTGAMRIMKDVSAVLRQGPAT